MTWLTIIKAALVAVIFIAGTLVPAGTAFFKALKGRRSAETEAAKEKANADLLASAKNFIVAAEVAFEGFDKMMKAQNGTAGPMKKDTVFSKLQAYALQNGYTFDAEEWSAKIDELVAFTKSVNAKKA
ncbi:MAG: hypothetical protein IKY65_04485 [Rikenellaceae bacterium]|nr:hypothetical protein [Rikenellaceae bacterium]